MVLAVGKNAKSKGRLDGKRKAALLKFRERNAARQAPRTPGTDPTLRTEPEAPTLGQVQRPPRPRAKFVPKGGSLGDAACMSTCASTFNRGVAPS